MSRILATGLVKRWMGVLRDHAVEEVRPILADEIRRLYHVAPDEARALVADAAADLAANAGIPWQVAAREEIQRRRASG